MKAMIFAAGLGTRLYPLTKEMPKALLEIGGVPLIEIIIRRLKLFGFDDIIINVHHFSEKIRAFVESKKNFGINITFSDESDQLLETGGGLKKVSWFFNDNKPFLLYNVDVISDINLLEMYRYHVNSKALATLAVRNRKTSRYFLFTQDKMLCGWKNMDTHEIKIIRKTESKLTSIAFSGIHLVNPKIFHLIQETGCFSITDVYLRLASRHKIVAFHHDDGLWFDMGTKDHLVEARKAISLEKLFDFK
jgi:N-acetyl-alpha-D-muramate 1-phosphate uridylyltransferase